MSRTECIEIMKTLESIRDSLKALKEVDLFDDKVLEELNRVLDSEEESQLEIASLMLYFSYEVRDLCKRFNSYKTGFYQLQAREADHSKMKQGYENLLISYKNLRKKFESKEEKERKLSEENKRLGEENKRLSEENKRLKADLSKRSTGSSSTDRSFSVIGKGKYDHTPTPQLPGQKDKNYERIIHRNFGFGGSGFRSFHG